MNRRARADGTGRGRRLRWLDLRLVPVAATVWAGTVAAPFLPSPALAVLAVVTGLLSARMASRRLSVAGVLVAGVLAAVAATAACAAVREVARASSPLLQAARPGLGLDLVVHLDGDPRPVSGPGARRVVVAATARELDEADRVVSLHDAVVLFGPADAWERLLPGQTVRVRAAVIPAPRGDGVVALLSARGPPALLGRPGWVQRAAGRLRDGLAASARRVLPSDAAGLLPGLVVGDTRSLDPVLAGDFRAAGLTHLVAVSGANVAIVLSGVLWPLRRRAVHRRVQTGVAAVTLVGFVVLVRPEASVLRAAAMGAVGLVALAGGRPRAAVPALSGAVIVLVLAEPALATDAGFALSVAATGAIVLLAPAWSRRLQAHRVPALLADALAVSAAAGVATAPLIAALSGQVSLVSLPANLLAAPAVAPATVLGLLAVLLAGIAPAVADAAVWSAGWPVRWLVLVAHRAAAVPDGVTAWPGGSTGAVVMTVFVLITAALLWRFPRIRLIALAAVVGVVLVGWPARQALRGWPPSATDMVACDVGQGDALVVPTGPHQGVLVDAGPDVGAEDRCLRRLGVRDVPLVLLSHLDADHVTGLAGALQGRRVGQVATGTLSPSDNRVGRIDALAHRAGVGRVTVAPGYRRTIGTATIEVLAPPPNIATASATPNDLCLLVRVTQRGVRILFTGDLSAEAEVRILDRKVDVRADVLKVPHHGSADTDPRFLAATGARVALVSVGAHNPYGHPAARTIGWLARDGMQVHRTDRQGDLAVVGSAGNWGSPPDEQRPTRRQPVRARSRPRASAEHRADARNVGASWQHAGVVAAPPAPTSRLRVVVGEEELLRARAVSAVRAAVLDRHPDVEVHELPAAGLPVGQLADVLAPSLFGGHRLVIVTGVQEAATALVEALSGCARDADPELTLVVVHFGGKRNEALLKAFTAAGAAVDECAKLKSPGDISGFVRNEIRSFGGRITADAVVALVDAVGNDLRQLSAAAAQLVADFGGNVDADVVARFHRGQAEVSGFDVAERTLVGDRQGSLELLRWALQRGVAHVLIADAIADGVRTAARVSSLNTSNVGDLARVLKLPPWKVKKAQAQSRGWSIDGLQQAIGVAAELNADVKGAAASPDYALERAIRRIVDIRTETGRGSRARAGR